MANQNFSKLGLPFPVPSPKEQRVDLDLKDVWYVLIYAMAGIYSVLVNNYAVKPFVAGKYRYKDDGSYQLFNPDSGKYHTVSLSGTEGHVTMNIGEGEI